MQWCIKATIAVLIVLATCIGGATTDCVQDCADGQGTQEDLLLQLGSSALSSEADELDDGQEEGEEDEGEEEESETPTAAPTEAPTAAPTAAPTPAPTPEEEPDEGEEEEEESPTPAPTEAPMPAPVEPADEEADEGEGSHWDFMNEEDSGEDVEHPTDGQHLGGIKGMVSEAIEEFVAPLVTKVDEMSEQVQTMHEEMVAAHEDEDTAEQVVEALEPLQSQLGGLEDKIDAQAAEHAAMATDVESVAENLKQLDDLDAAVKNAATSQDLQDTKGAIIESVEEHEQNVASALGAVHKKTTDNGKILKKLYKDVHFGSR